MFLAMKDIEAVTEAVSQAAEEATTEFPYVIPDGYDLSVTIPKFTLIAQILLMFVIAAAMVAMVILVSKKQKGTMISFVGGIALYMLFVTYLPSIVYSLVFLIPVFKEMNNNYVFTISLSVVVTAGIGISGRLLCMKMYERYQSARFFLSVGLGVMASAAVSGIMLMFTTYTVGNLIDMDGIEKTLQTGSFVSQEAFNSHTAQFYQNYVNLGFGGTICEALEYLLMMVYHLAITVPLMAAFQDKESKGWYGFAFGTFGIIALGQNLVTLSLVPRFVEVIAAVIAVAPTVYFAVRMYKDYYEAEEEEARKENERKNTPPAKKPMPKFGDLSKL